MRRENYLTFSVLVLLIVFILGAVSNAIYSVRQIDNREIAPYIAIVTNNLGVKTKLVRLEATVKEFHAKPTESNAKMAQRSYRIMSASILNDVESELTRQLHEIHGDVSQLEEFISRLKGLKSSFGSLEVNSSNTRQIIRTLEGAYRFWNLYSGEIVQRVQAQHDLTLSSWDEKHTNQLIMLIAIAFASIAAVGLVFAQYMSQVRLSANLEQQAIKLKRAKQQAEESAESKARFLANMSHEIRTPMNGVVGMLQILKRSQLNQKQIDQLNIAINSADSLLVLINDILDYSKIDSGKLNIETVEFNIHEQYQAVIETTMIMIPDDADLQLKLDDSGLEEILVVGDPIRLRQIVTNLVSNAIKFTSSGHVTLSASLQEKAGNGLELRCSVQDTGLGIEPQKLESLFEAFTQADDSTTRKFGGTGLGLSICKRLCELMGGSISASSEPGKGSCFSFEIMLEKAVSGTESDPTAEHVSDIQNDSVPAEDSLENVNSESGSNSSNDGANKPFNGQHILLVEDNKVNQLVAQHMLTQLGLQVDIRANGKEALEALNEGSYSLILMDCQMPEMDGFEATQRIRNGEAGDDYLSTPIVALTANAMQGDRERCLAAGMDDYISKPVEAEEFKSTLSKNLSSVVRD